MPRPRSPYSDASDNEMDGGNEVELQRLLKAYRVMQLDHKSYCQESQEIIKKQRKEVEQLNNDREESVKTLRLVESRTNQTQDDKNCESLGELGRKKKNLEDEIAGEKKKQEELKAETREWSKKKREQARNSGGNQTSAQSNSKASKDQRKLENKLQLANNKFSDGLEVNKTLRSEIDSLRVERKRFEEMHKKLDKERQKLNEEIGEIIDQATTAHDQREEAQAKMILLKEKSDKDIQQHNTEMKELIRIIDHDKKLRQFMNTKCKERTEDAQLVKWRQQREAAMAERMKASQTDSVETYEEAFERIKEMRQEDDINLLVKDFIRTEDKNFALFNYVNEQNNEIELLQEQIDDINAEIARFQAQGVELEAEREAILKRLDSEQTSAAKDANVYDDKYKDVSKILDQLRAGVESLFGKIGCDPSSINDMLGSNTGVSNQNMIQYMGVVEERTNHLLAIQTYIHNKQEEDQYIVKKPQLLGDGPKPAPKSQNILPPTVGDEYDSDGSDTSDAARPFTRNELIKKAMHSVQKREQNMRSETFKYDLTDARDKQSKKKY